MSERGNGRGPVSLFAACAFFMLASIGLWLVSLFSGGLFPGLTSYQRTLAVNVMYYVPFVFLPIAWWAALREDGDQVLRLNPVSAGTTLRVVCIALLTVLVAENASYLWMVLCQKLGLDVLTSSYVRPENTMELSFSILTVSLVAPVCEEMLFRGVMLSAWEDRSGARRAVAVTTVLFALMHGNVLGLPAELFAGLLIGLIVLWTDSLYSGMIFHATYNAALVILSYLSTASDTASEAVEADLWTSLGGAAGAAMLIINILLSLAMIVVISRRMQLRYALRHVQNKEDEAGKRAPSFRPGTLFGEDPREKVPMTAGEVIVLMAGLVSCGAMYLLEILSLL